MTPFLIYAVTAAIIAFTVGFFVGKKAGKRKNQQNVEYFVDLEVATKAREKGRRAVQERIEKRKVRIMALARKQGRITNDDVEDLFCISDSTARNYLNELEHKGELTQHGETGRGVYYTPTPFMP